MDDKEDVGELLVGEELATTRQDVFIKREIFLKIDSQPSPNVDSQELGVLNEVYKAPVGSCSAFIQKLEDVSFEKADPFLSEAGISLEEKTGLSLDIKLSEDACSEEVPPTIKCMFVTGLTDVREERQMVQQRKECYRCLGKDGQFLRSLVSASCFSLLIGVGF